MGERRAETLHFFKIILPSTLEDKKLRIPPLFVRGFGDKLSVVATLTVPNGRVWKVGLKREGGKIWFSDGWNEFAEYHSIYAGCFLFFKYQENSKFHVLIFDKTACEIQYPNDSKELENVQRKRDDVKESRPGKLNNIKMYTSKESLHSKKHRNRNAEDINASSSSFALEPVKKRTKYDERELLALFEDMGIGISSRNGCFTAEEKERAIYVARSVKPKNPAFLVILSSFNITRKRLHVPANFANKYFDGKGKHIKVQDSRGKEWSFRVGWSGSLGYSLESWAPFSKDNKLEKGDICLFELIMMQDTLLKVSVYHTPKYI